MWMSLKLNTLTYNQSTLCKCITTSYIFNYDWFHVYIHVWISCYCPCCRFCPWRSDPSKQIKFLVDLLSQAAEREEQTGEKTLKLVSSVCTYNTFPFPFRDNSEQSDFLLDLCSHVKDYETQTGRSVLPALQPVYQSAPAVWSIDLSERKASLLLEVLKLQPEKKPVELKGWSDEESEVRSFLQCLPYISQLRWVWTCVVVSDYVMLVVIIL